MEKENTVRNKNSNMYPYKNYHLQIRNSQINNEDVDVGGK